MHNDRRPSSKPAFESRFSSSHRNSSRTIRGGGAAGALGTARVACPQKIQAVVEDLGTGVYTATYSSNVAGPLSVRVQFDNGDAAGGLVDLEGSPSAIFVVPRVKTVAPGVNEPARTSPSTGPVRGGTVVTVDHEIWQPLSQVRKTPCRPRSWANFSLL